ncbi:MAG: hypothetical protein ACKVSF_13565 [Alphaproteobacteria bacterium]
MFSDVKRHMLYRIGNAPARPYPYAHFFLEGVFPDDFYAELRRRLPSAAAYTSIAQTGRVTRGAYPERAIFFLADEALGALDAEAARFWRGARELLLDQELMALLIAKFEGAIQKRFADLEGDVTAEPETYLVKDGTGYHIGPHTDAPHRLLSALFYLPADSRWRAHGTSLYLPADRKFTCEGGPHYHPEPFERIATMEYLPNSLFAFAKSDNSFHGVERVEEQGVVRDIVLYDVRLEGEMRRKGFGAATPAARDEKVMA